MAHRSPSQVAQFPTPLVASVGAATLVLLAWLSWSLYGNYKAAQEDRQILLKLSTARGQIVHLDEVLTMSATMAAATGETDWIDRYRSFEPQLLSAIKTAESLARSSGVEVALRRTDDANAALVLMENQAFDMVRDGQADGARRLLSSENYRAQKQIYADGMRELDKSLADELLAIEGKRQQTARNGVIATVSVSAMILLTWLFVLQRVRLWRINLAFNYEARVAAEAALRDANSALETKVAERTQELQKQLKARELAEKKLLEVQRMRTAGQLTGGVAHEFNNLLAVIKSNAEDLREELTDSTLARKQAELVVQAADRGAGFVSQLLAFSRKQDIEPKLLDINEFLAPFIELTRSTLEKSIKLEVYNGENIPLINVDPGQLETALMNIILNSRDAIPGTGTITIETENIFLDAETVAGIPGIEAGAFVLIAITDTGTGMPKDVVESAFVPFFTTKPVGEGTGLGLSTVHGFVTQSGGLARIYSELGHGTTVKLYFPVARSDRNTGDPGASSSVHASAGTRILIVEDDALVRQTVEGRLQRQGYTIASVPTAEHAIAYLEANPDVDLVFSDVIMPGSMSGGDLAWEVQKRWPAIRILLTSGYTESTTLGKVKIPPGVRLLSKPYASSALVDAIQNALARTDVSVA